MLLVLVCNLTVPEQLSTEQRNILRTSGLRLSAWIIQNNNVRLPGASFSEVTEVGAAAAGMALVTVQRSPTPSTTSSPCVSVSVSENRRTAGLTLFLFSGPLRLCVGVSPVPGLRSTGLLKRLLASQCDLNGSSHWVSLISPVGSSSYPKVSQVMLTAGVNVC